MKKMLLIAAVALLGVMQLGAQNLSDASKIGYINTETILSKIPEYKTAQEKLELLGSQYKDKVEGEFKKIETLYQNYQSSKATLGESLRAQKENEIISKERTAKELQKTYFGQDGIMQKKSEELLNPIKERVQVAIDKIAKEGNYTLVFDLAAVQGVAYSNEKDNLSNTVLKVLGY